MLAAREKRGVGLEREGARSERVQNLGREKEVAPDQRLSAASEKIFPGRFGAQVDRVEMALHRRQPRTGVELAAELVVLAGETGRTERAHHAVQFRRDDVVAGDLLQIVRDGPVVGDAALEDDVAAVVEEQFADAGHDRPRLRPAGSADDVAHRKAVLEFVDAGGGEHGADAREFEVAAVVGAVGHLFDRNVELDRHTVEEGAGAGGADAAHLVIPHVHLLVEYHRLAVLAADVENRLAVRVVVACAGHMGGHFADLEVIRQEIVGILDDLAAGHDRAGDFAESLHAGIHQEFINGLPELAEVAGSAFGADAGTADPPRIDRARTPVERLPNLAAFIQQDCLESGRPDVDPEI